MLRAARYLGVAPWELEQQSIAWTNWALMAESAEHEAEAILAKKAQGSKSKR